MTDAGEPAGTAPTPGAFFSLHYKPLLQFIYRRTGDLQLAEELAADCILLACRHGDDGAMSRAWLFATARNKIGDAIRKQKRERRLVAHLVEHAMLSMATTPRSTAVKEAMHELGPRDREVLLLTYWNELTAPEVAEALGISVDAVWKRSSRAQRRLRALLDDQTRVHHEKAVMNLALD